MTVMFVVVFVLFFVNGVARARSSVLWHILLIKEILVLQL